MNELEVEQLIKDNKHIVKFVIHTYFQSLSDDEDIHQIGLIALWKAIEAYMKIGKSKKHATLQTYARNVIKNEILHELEKRQAHIRKLNDMNFTTSLEMPVNGNEDLTLAEVVPSKTNTETLSIINSSFYDLSEDEKQVISMKIIGFTNKEIASRFETTPYFVTKCIESAYGKLAV